jgi:hypothetical protein
MRKPEGYAWAIGVEVFKLVAKTDLLQDAAKKGALLLHDSGAITLDRERLRVLEGREGETCHRKNG